MLNIHNSTIFTRLFQGEKKLSQREDVNWYPYSEIEQLLEFNISSAKPQVKVKSSFFVDNNLKIVDVNYCRTHNKAIGNILY